MDVVHASFMNLQYAGGMSRILQVRDIPEGVVAKLSERAEGQGISLSAYVRALLADDAERETLDEVIARISTRESVDVSVDPGTYDLMAEDCSGEEIDSETGVEVTAEGVTWTFTDN